MTLQKYVACYIFAFILIGVTKTLAQTFTETNIGSLPKNYEAETLWLDVDNDGDSDVIMSGQVSSQVAVYTNSGGFLTFHFNTDFPALLHPLMGTADFNRDGFLDLVLTGIVYGGDVNPTMGGGVYLNNGSGSFTKATNASVVLLSGGSVDCADFDLDGDADILMTGSDNTRRSRTVIMVNNGDGTFTELTHQLPTIRAVYGSNGSWGDFDRDGDFDILLSGQNFDSNGVNTGVTKVFVNNGNRTFTESQISLAQFDGKSEWVDVNNDGWIDIFVSGYRPFEYTAFAKLYINQGGSFTEGAVLTGTSPFFDFKWTDFDNDGDRDLLTRESWNGFISLYVNNGGTSFTKNTDTYFPQHTHISTADFENDGDFDIMLTGYTDNFTTSVLALKNNSTQTNAASGPPGNLTANVSGQAVSLKWEAPTDPESASTSLEYVLRIGTSAGASDVVSPLTTLSGHNLGHSATTGFLTTQAALYDFPPGTYYATVQAIDQSARVSLPSNTAVFTVSSAVLQPATPIGLILSITSTNYIALRWIDQSVNENSFSIERSEDGISFEELTTVSKNVMRYIDKTVSLGHKYFYRVRAVNASDASDYTTIQSITNTKGFFKKLDGFEVPENGNNLSISVDWIDYDNDGLDDLFFATSGLPNYLYLNKGDGRFDQVTSGNIITGRVQNRRSCWADYDNDGDMDVFIPTSYKGRLFNNNGGVFTEVTGAPFDQATSDTYGVSWVDYDNDGFLDLSVLYYQAPSNLFHNNGNGTFSQVTEGVFIEDVQNFVSISWCDYDNDGWQDALAVNYGGDLILYRNNKGISFERVSDPIIKSAEGALTASWADYDTDGDFDVFIGHNVNVSDTFFENNGDGSFTKIFNSITDSNFRATSSSWGDIDNDGQIDLFLTSDDEKAVFFNNGDRSFRMHKDEPSFSDRGYSEGIALGDYNRDGFLDAAIPTTYMDNLVLKNNGNSNHWISFRLQGTQTNRNAIGAKVTISTGLKRQMNYVASHTGFSSQNSFNVEFGLANATLIDSVVLEWPRRGYQILTDIAADQFLNVVEPDFPASPVLTIVSYDGNNQIVNLNWNRVAGASKYIIERSIGDRHAFERLVIQNDTSGYADEMPIELDSVFYRVSVLSGNNASVFSNVKGTLCGLRSPNDIQAEAQDNSVKLSWSDASAREEQYQVHRSSGASNFESIATTSANTTHYIDGAVGEQVNYYYTLRAVNGSVTSRFSDTVSVTTLLRAPDNVMLSFSADAITLEWRDNSQKETSYLVERSDGNNQQFTVIGTVNSNAIAFNDTAFDLNQALYYRLQAKNSEGVSPYSEEVNATVTAAETAVNPQMLVFPNPANATVNIKAPLGKKHFSVISPVGLEILSFESQEELTSIDVRHLPSGIYIISTILDGKRTAKRISVTK